MGIREKILNSVDMKKELITVDEWDVTIEVRSLNGKQRSKLVKENIDVRTGAVDLENMYPDLIILSSFDPENGNPIFSESDREELKQKNSGALDKVFAVASKLSGLDNNSVKKAEKN